MTEDLRARSALPPHVAKVGRGEAVGVGAGAGLCVRYCGGDDVHAVNPSPP